MSIPAPLDYAEMAQDLRLHALELDIRAAAARVAADALDELAPPPRRPRNGRSAEAPAPYGHKADGTPRKRPALSPEAQTRAAAARSRKRDEVGAELAGAA